jgi:hypothetical protein
MRAIAGSVLVLGAAVVLAAVLIASHMPSRNADEGTVKSLLILASLVVGDIGMGLILNELMSRVIPTTTPPK